jgi:hypothetical protein
MFEVSVSLSLMEFLAIAIDSSPEPGEPRAHPQPCPSCGGRMLIIETCARGCQPPHHPTPTDRTTRGELVRLRSATRQL